MVEMNGLDIPYNAEGFEKWLTTSCGMTARKTRETVELIRQADIELWQPGDPEIFQQISRWVSEAANTKFDSVRTLLRDFVILTIAEEISQLESLKEEVEKGSEGFLNNVIAAYRQYLTFMKVSLCYSDEEWGNLMNDEGVADNVNQLKRYAPVPLDKEFRQYLTDCRFRVKNRDKMMSKLRKLNELVINNGRGDSDWLGKLVERVKAGENIGRARFQASTMYHSVLANITSEDEINGDDLSGGQTALNHYIEFLISTYGKQRSSK